MGILTQDMKRVVNEQQLGFIATVCPDGTPNLSPKGTTAVLDDNHLVFADVCSPRTIANLRLNSAVEINVVDPLCRKGYRFKGVGGGPIKSVVVKADEITVKGGKDKWTYTLNAPRQGSVAVRLRLGDMDGWCANAPALAQGKPPSTAQTDRPDLFKSERNAPAPAACPAVPAGGSASGAFLD